MSGADAEGAAKQPAGDRYEAGPPQTMHGTWHSEVARAFKVRRARRTPALETT